MVFKKFTTLVGDRLDINGSVHAPGEVEVEIERLVIPRELLPSDIESDDDVRELIKSSDTGVLHDSIDICGSVHKRGRADVTINEVEIRD